MTHPFAKSDPAARQRQTALVFGPATPPFWLWCKGQPENHPERPGDAAAWADRKCIGKDRLMPTGTVEWFNTTKGFGFIAPDDGGNDGFVQISAVERAGMTGLPDNMKVSFELRDGRSSAVALQRIG